MAKRIEKALVKRFCEKNFTEFLARVEKMVSVFLSSPLIGKVQKQDFVNNQALTKRILIFTLSEKLRKETDFRQNSGQNGLISESRVCFLRTGRNVVKPFESTSFTKK